MALGSSFSSENAIPDPARKASSSFPSFSDSATPCAVSSSIWLFKTAVVFCCWMVSDSLNCRAEWDSTPAALRIASTAATTASAMKNQ